MSTKSSLPKRNRRRGALFLEILLTTSIVAIAGLNYQTSLLTSVLKAKWAQARILEGQLNNTYSGFVGLGGSHEGPLFEPDNAPSGFVGVSSTASYQVHDISPAPGTSDKLLMDFELISLVKDADFGNRHVFVTAYADMGDVYLFSAEQLILVYDFNDDTTGVTRDTVEVDPNRPIGIFELDLNTFDAILHDGLFQTPPNEGDGGAELTLNLWDLFTSPAGTPIATGNNGIYTAQDSSRGLVNSSAIRMTNVPNADSVKILDSLGDGNSILYDGDFRITFTPTSSQSGVWSVVYEG